MAMRQAFTPKMLAKEITYSPTQVANEELLPWLRRAMIYRLIQRGKINVVIDEYGHKRITLEEIERLRKERRKEEEEAATDAEKKAEIRRHLNRAAALHRVATTSTDALIAPMLQARRADLARRVDPDGTCSPEELERRIEAENRSHMEKMTAKQMAKRRLKQQYQTTHSPA